MTSTVEGLAADAASRSNADGPRQRRRQAVRRRRRRSTVLLVAAVAAAILSAFGVRALLGDGAAEEVAGTPAGSAGADGAAAASAGGPGKPSADAQTTLLVTVTDAGRATSATLLAAGPGDAPATALFLPVRTLLEVPGVGLDRLELAAQYGGGELLGATVDNALGIRIDEVIVSEPADLAALLGVAGPLTVDVPERLVARAEDGSADVRFEAGSAVLDGERLADLWSFTDGDADELSSFPRRQRILGALLHALPGGGDRAMADGAGAVTPVLDALAVAQREDRLAFDVLPVEPFGGDGDGRSAYRLDEDAAAALVRGRLASSAAHEQPGDTIRVQVLNGVGTPGVGALVDDLLGGSGVRVVLTDNARSFDFDATQIVVYDESEGALRAARQVRDHLGVGSIRVSRQPQSVVDLTIVVGRDLAADGP